MKKTITCIFVLLGSLSVLLPQAFAKEIQLWETAPINAAANGNAAVKYAIGSGGSDQTSTGTAMAFSSAYPACADDLFGGVIVGSYDFLRNTNAQVNAASAYAIAVANGVDTAAIRGIRVQPVDGGGAIFTGDQVPTPTCFQIDCSSGSECIYSGAAVAATLKS